MAAENVSAGTIAKALKVSDGKVKKAIAELKLKPAEKKGVCNLYAPKDIERIKKLVSA